MRPADSDRSLSDARLMRGKYRDKRRGIVDQCSFALSLDIRTHSVCHAVLYMACTIACLISNFGRISARVKRCQQLCGPFETKPRCVVSERAVYTRSLCSHLKLPVHARSCYRYRVCVEAIVASLECGVIIR